VVSMFSAAYKPNNPFSHSWLFEWLTFLQWIKYT
jgi:hypothetical protein